MSTHSRRNFIKNLGTLAGMSPLVFMSELGSFLDEEWKDTNFNAFDRLDESYMLSKDITYLNHASIGTIPRSVVEVHKSLLETCESNPWLHMWGGEWEEPREEIRGKAAKYINADPKEVSINHNTTEMYNLLAMGLPLSYGDEVLFSNLNHAGASIPFQIHSKRKGYKVVKFEIPLDKVDEMTKEEIIDHHISQITPKTQLLVLPHIDNTVGMRVPVKEITAEARRLGVEWVTLDAAQTVGMIPYDTQEFDLDLMATSTHKWIQTPKGVNFGFIRENLFDVLEPMLVTWGNARWQGTARIYEDYGTRNFPEVITMGASIDFQAKIDMEAKQKHLIDLWKYTQKKADEHPKTKWRSSREWELGGSLYAIEIKGEKASDCAKRIYDDHGIVLRPFDAEVLNTVRISPNLITKRSDIDRFFEVV